MIPFQPLLRQWGLDMPDWLLSLGVGLAGTLLALLLRMVVSRSLRFLKFDVLGEKTGLIGFLRKGRVRLSLSQLAGAAAFWVLFIATLLQVAFVLDIGLVTRLLTGLETYLPRAFTAVLIVVIGGAATSFVANFCLTLARNAAWSQASLLAKAVRTAGWILLVALAAEQLSLQLAVFQSLILIVAGAFALGLALAFGLGCQDLARDAMKRFLIRLREQDHSRKGPDFEG